METISIIIFSNHLYTFSTRFPHTHTPCAFFVNHLLFPSVIGHLIWRSLTGIDLKKNNIARDYLTVNSLLVNGVVIVQQGKRQERKKN